MTFFVLAPPRCMTAWLANLLTTDCTTCHHDAMAFGGIGRLRQLAAPEVGFAETGGLYVPQTLLDLFPDARFVLVLADLQRVATSLRGIGVDGDAFIQDFAPRAYRAAELLQGRALVVRDTEVLERAGDIAEYLTGQRPSEARLTLLRALNITKAEPLRGDRGDARALINMEA